MSEIIKNIQLIETHINKEALTKEQQDLLDFEQLKRFFIIINWKDNVDEQVENFIRDLLKINYSLPVKYLKCISFSYVCQKSNKSEKSDDINSAGVLIEPLNNDFEKYITQIPISQKIKLGTKFLLNKKISYDESYKNRKFLWSNNLECIDKNEKHLVLRNCHIGAMEIGSEIKAKFTVDTLNHLKDNSTVRLFGFRRHPNDKQFIIEHWNFWDYTSLELLNKILEFVKNDYEEPKINHNDANDYGANILYKENLINVLNEIIKKLPSKITDSGTIEITEKYII